MARMVLGASVLGVPAATAQAVAETGWRSTPLHEKQGPGGTYRSKAFIRFVRAKKPFSVGQVTFFSVPSEVVRKSKDPFNAKIFKADMERALGVSLLSRRQGKAWVYEGLMMRDNRFVRIYVSDDGHQLSYSVALVRLGYLQGIVLETELLQRGLAGELKYQQPWFKKVLNSACNTLFGEDAMAEGCPTGTCPSGPAGYGCLLAQSSCEEKQISGDIHDMNATFKSAQKDISDLNANTKDALAEMRRGLNDFEATSAKATAEWDRTNDQITRTNDLIERFLNPGEAFVLAAAGAAGAALGAAAIGFGIEAVGAGVKWVVDKITGASEKARIIQRFREGREAWAKLDATVRDLEKVIDNVVAYKEMSNAFGATRTQLLEKLEPDLAETRSSLRTHEKKLDAIPESDGNCRHEEALEVAKYQARADGLNDLLRTLREDPGDRAFCSQLRGKLDDLAVAEGQLQEARGKILGGKLLWQRSFEDAQEESEQDFARARKEAAKSRDEAISQAKDRMERRISQARDAYYNDPTRVKWIDWCWHEDQDFFQSLPIFGAAFGSFGVRDRCATKWDKSINKSNGMTRDWTLTDIQVKIRQDESREEIAAEGAYQAQIKDHNRTLAASGLTTDEKVATLDWITRLNDDQACAVSDGSTGAHLDPKCGVISRIRTMEHRKEKIDELCGPNSVGQS
ncbi:MAG TPA: hypothetical protein VL588_04685 [Bdellovibrionota bacterium]|nr:hypothetical protein [Bdellovibrionota bacterium]